MYEKILVPLDGSELAEWAVRHAEEIARGTGAEILLLQAVYLPMPIVPEAVLIAGGKAVEEAGKEAAAYLEKMAESLRAEGFRVRTMVEERPPADAILRIADREEVDAIVMSTHGRSGLSRLVMGSVAESVLHATGRPVMLVKPAPPAVAAQKEEDWYLHVP
jgi:nucleotide-binding universal stress UspA family protein